MSPLYRLFFLRNGTAELAFPKSEPNFFSFSATDLTPVRRRLLGRSFFRALFFLRSAPFFFRLALRFFFSEKPDRLRSEHVSTFFPRGLPPSCSFLTTPASSKFFFPFLSRKDPVSIDTFPPLDFASAGFPPRPCYFLAMAPDGQPFFLFFFDASAALVVVRFLLKAPSVAELFCDNRGPFSLSSEPFSDNNFVSRRAKPLPPPRTLPPFFVGNSFITGRTVSHRLRSSPLRFRALPLFRAIASRFFLLFFSISRSFFSLLGGGHLFLRSVRVHFPPFGFIG